MRQSGKIYNLKRRYGKSATYYSLLSQGSDLKTGVTANSWDTPIDIKRALLYSVRQLRNFLDVSRIQPIANMFDTKAQVAIVDKADVPVGFAPKGEDHMEIGGKRFEIKHVEIDDESQAYIFIVVNLNVTPAVG